MPAAKKEFGPENADLFAPVMELVETKAARMLWAGTNASCVGVAELMRGELTLEASAP